MIGASITPTPRDVVIYARVSTEHEAQLSALENQLDWYKPLLDQHPEWNLIHSYVDEGITVTSASKRPQFMRMLADAQRGEFSLILTREVSRFARNTVDTLQYTRDLKRIGVEVFFINDNIRTFDGDGELRLTIMATLAQDESRKTSIRVKSGQQTSMENGVYYGNGNILGYDRVGKELVINPEQARTVRKIYDWYLDGKGIRQIQFELEKEGFLTATGKTRWYESNISKILRNPFYAGIIEYHKQFTPDYLEQKRINNFGEVERLRVKGRHEPIITEAEFNKVQELMEYKRQLNPINKPGRRDKGKHPTSDIWGRLLVCSCGCTFNRKVWHTVSNGAQYGYMCYAQLRSGTIRTRLNKGLPVEGYCTSQMIPGWKLQLMAKHLFRKYLKDTDRILQLAQEMLAKHIQDKALVEDHSEIIAQKQAELSKLEKRLGNLITMRADAMMGDNTGWCLENMVCIELLRRIRPQWLDLYYFKTSYEVDFVVCNGNTPIHLYQVTVSMDDAKTRRREVGGLLKGAKDLQCERMTIITLSEKKTICEDGHTIEVVPIIEWLLLAHPSS